MNLACPHCQRAIGIPDQLVGRAVACPHCKKTFVSEPPAPSEPPSPSEPPGLSRREETASAPPDLPVGINPTARPPSTGETPVPQEPAEASTAPAVRHFAISLTPATLRWIAASCFFLNLLLLFFPWLRVLSPTLLAGSTPPPAVKDLALIVGCPASMNERTPSDDLKIEAVKQTAGTFIDQLPDELRLALLVYGRDRIDVCGVEVVRKPAPLDAAARAEMKKIISSLNPVGLAPLAEALNTAREVLADASAAGVVLFADGLDTCNGDAKAAAAALAKLPQFTYGVHIVGIGVIPKELRHLRAAAEAGNGAFADNQTTPELSHTVTALAQQTGAAAEQEVIVNALANRRHTGFSNAFGEQPAPAAGLLMIYVLLVLAGLVGATALLVINRLPQTMVGQTFQSAGRLESLPHHPWLTAGLAAISAFAFIALLVQLLIGMPVENDFERYVFTYRTSWVTLAVLVQMIGLAASLGLIWLQNRQDDHWPELRVDW